MTKVHNLFKKYKVNIEKFNSKYYFDLKHIAKNICESINIKRYTESVKSSDKILINHVPHVTINIAISKIQLAKAETAKLFIKKYDKIIKSENNDSDDNDSDDESDEEKEDKKKNNKNDNDEDSNSDSDEEDVKSKSKKINKNTKEKKSNNDDDSDEEDVKSNSKKINKKTKEKKSNNDNEDNDDDSDEETTDNSKKKKTEEHISNNDNSIFKLYKNIYKYDDTSIDIIRINNELWFKGKDITKLLDYNNGKQAILLHVNNDCKKTYKALKKYISFKGVYNLDPLKVGFDPQTIFIDQTGLFSLVLKSKKPEAIKFQKWISTEILPKIFKYGTYSSTPIDFKNYNFYNDNLISAYSNKRVIYLAYIGEYNGEYILKFGISNDFPRRELKEHRKTFKIFNVLFIAVVDANIEVEKLLKIEFNAKNIIRNIKINNKMQTELIALNNNFNVDNCIDLIKNLISTNKLPSQNKYETENQMLKEKIKDKDEIIKSKDETIKSKDDCIELLKGKSK